MRQSASAPRTERVRTPDSLGVPAARTRNTADDNNNDRPAKKNKEATAPTSQPLKKPAAAMKASNVSSRGQDSRRGAPRNGLQRVGAPSIRFPKPEVRDNRPTPSPVSGVRSYGSSGAAPSAMDPKFYRAADGTQIVQFPDGSTRFVHPGKTGTQAASPYR